MTFSKDATPHDKQIVAFIFNITHQDTLEKCLGFPLFKGHPKLETFSKLVNKTAARLPSWAANNISEAGCVALIQTNAESMLAHTMQCFQLLCTTSM